MSLSQDIARIKQKFLKGEDWKDLLEEFELRYKSHPFAPVVKKLKDSSLSFSPSSIIKSLRKFYKAYIRSMLGEDVSPYQEFITSLSSSVGEVPASASEAEQENTVSQVEPFEEISFEKVTYGESEHKGELPEQVLSEAETPAYEGKSELEEYVPLWKREFEKERIKFIVLVRGENLFAVPFGIIESFIAEPYLREHPFSPVRGVFGMIFRNGLIPVIDIFRENSPPKGVVVLRHENKFVGVAFDSVKEEVEEEFFPDEKEMLSGSYYMGSIEIDGTRVKVVNPALLDRVYC